jgi:hypothetical protein
MESSSARPKTRQPRESTSSHLAVASQNCCVLKCRPQPLNTSKKFTFSNELSSVKRLAVTWSMPSAMSVFGCVAISKSGWLAMNVMCSPHAECERPSAPVKRTRPAHAPPAAHVCGLRLRGRLVGWR